MTIIELLLVTSRGQLKMSEAKRDSEFEIAKLKFPSIKLEKELLASIYDFVESEYEKVSSDTNDSVYSIDYKLEGKDRDREWLQKDFHFHG